MSDSTRFARPAMHSALVTGSSGFIGSHLTRSLLKAGVEVTGLDCRVNDDPPRGLRCVTADVLDADLGRLVAGCEVVFHLAAIPGVRGSWGARFEDYLAVNVLGTHRLVEACERANVPRLVLASSSSVYGGRGASPSREDGATEPTSPYGVTKLAAERLAIAHALKPDAALAVIALRYFSVYGPRQRDDMLIARALRAAQRGTPLQINGSGLQHRDYTYVGDVVAATMRAASSPGQAEVVNVGSGLRTSIDDVLATVERVTGRPVRSTPGPPVAGDPPGTWADLQRANRLLGPSSSADLYRGVVAQWQFMQREAAVGLPLNETATVTL